MIALGQRVRFTRALWRTTGGDGPVRGSIRKQWEPSPDWAEHGPKEGVVVGTRTLQNGYVLWGSYEDPSTWHVESTVPSVLVSTHLRANPVHVHPDDIEIVHPDRVRHGGTVTLPSGSTLRVVQEPDGQVVVRLSNPDAPADLRDFEAGRVIGGGFQTPIFAAYTLSPAALRGIADLIEEHHHA